VACHEKNSWVRYCSSALGVHCCPVLLMFPFLVLKNSRISFVLFEFR
jgi:hypothetical protein